MSASESVTWIKVERPSFDLAGVLISSLQITGGLLVIALVLGTLFGLTMVWRRRGQDRSPPSASPSACKPGPEAVVDPPRRLRRMAQCVRAIDIHNAPRHIEVMAGPAEPRGPRQITRYENRKLYDVEGRTYVTLEQLRGRVVAGEDLEVIDQKTGEDLTTLTLAQVLLEGLRGTTARIPRQILAHLIRLAFGSHLPEGAGGRPQDAAARARQEAERIAGGLLAKGRLTLDEAAAFRHELGRSVHHIVDEAQAATLNRLRGLFVPGPEEPRTALLGLDQRLDDLARKVEGRPRHKPRRTRTAATRRS